ncbi:MAG: hypothetical protein JWL72_2660, partial [Ilumatobacteraceae bacterium]|nr:hypothetical protein [Ilumatobacteraceae bacterium]
LGAISVDSADLPTTSTVYSPYSSTTLFGSATPVTDANGNVIATTGSNSTDSILIGLALTLLGVGCLVLVRRRTPASTD